MSYGSAYLPAPAMSNIYGLGNGGFLSAANLTQINHVELQKQYLAAQGYPDLTYRPEALPAIPVKQRPHEFYWLRNRVEDILWKP